MFGFVSLTNNFFTKYLFNNNLNKTVYMWCICIKTIFFTSYFHPPQYFIEIYELIIGLLFKFMEWATILNNFNYS
uniref:Uncharacterized protein n=1 Tax=Lepeophtheirus salmonis TaxID=72036 RepID=A0A0K2TXU6_LEPSM